MSKIPSLHAVRSLGDRFSAEYRIGQIVCVPRRMVVPSPLLGRPLLVVDLKEASYASGIRIPASVRVASIDDDGDVIATWLEPFMLVPWDPEEAERALAVHVSRQNGTPTGTRQ